jgi:branched-chain amino acid aminotransferase/4-amino-4-deoxychorismate lyase
VIDPTDRGFALGDGLFETVLAERGDLRSLIAHLDRMTAGCAVIGLPPPDRREAEATMRAALAAAGLARTRAAVRLTLTAGGGGRGLDRPEPLEPFLVATAAPAPKPQAPARLIVSAVRRNDRSPTSRLKTLAYLDNVLARREARAAGADEALMLDTAGRLACAAAANLFWLKDGRLFTPALDCGVLPGIMRARVLAAARAQKIEVAEVAEGPEILASAEQIFLTNSLIGLRRAVQAGDEAVENHRLVDSLERAVESD